MREGLERGVCSTARFVDRLFGREHEYSEYEDQSNGRASVTLGWNELDEFEVDTRFRVSVNLPQINDRFNATIGRASRDEYVADELTLVGPSVGAFSDDEPAEWFAGVGYRVLRNKNSRFDLGAGIKLQSPLNPYANARYRYYIHAGPETLVTLRTTAFVENDEGFGVTQAFDIDHVLSHDYLLRFGIRCDCRRRPRRALAQSRGALSGDRLQARNALRGQHPRRDGWHAARPVWAARHSPPFRIAGLAVHRVRGRLVLGGRPGAGGIAAMPASGATVGFEVLFGEAYDRVLRSERTRAESRPIFCSDPLDAGLGSPVRAVEFEQRESGFAQIRSGRRRGGASSRFDFLIRSTSSAQDSRMLAAMFSTQSLIFEHGGWSLPKDRVGP